MAQLTDDCFAFGGPMLSVDGVERLMSERVTAVAECSDVALAHAIGRVTASDVRSSVNLPSFDNSAVDGYAVRFADLNKTGETRLRVAGRVQAGSSGVVAVQVGDAVRIFTGAAMPSGTDTVFMQEDVQALDDAVVVPSGLKPGANRRLIGEDVTAGSVVLKAACRLQPQHIAMASAIGLTHLNVRRKVSVALFSTGDEIVEPGSPLRHGTVYDANRPLLLAMARRLGADVTDLGILADEPSAVAEALAKAARDHDLVLTSGGVSTGEADHVRSAVEKAGRLVFWRIAIKPGRPVAMGVLNGQDGHNAAFVGLPGNPVAAFVTFARVVRPLLLRLMGADIEPLVAFPVRATFAYAKKTGRREYVRVALARAADGVLEASKHAQDGAGVISSLTATDGLAELPEDVTSVAPGDRVGFISYATLMG